MRLVRDRLGRAEIVGNIELPPPGYFMMTERPALATSMHRWIDDQGVDPYAMGSGIPPEDLHRFMLRRRQRISGVGANGGTMYLKKDSLGRTEIVGSGELRLPRRRRRSAAEVGFLDVLSKAENIGMISAPQPTQYSVTVYQQRRKRFGNEAYWDRDTNFTGATAEEVQQKARQYVQSKGWQLASG